MPVDASSSTQVRLHVRAPRQRADAIYLALETAFEEDGAPLALAEVDEARQVFEVSLYVAAEDADADARRFASAASVAEAEVLRETLPDKDWMADVLAALKPVRAGRFLVHGAHDRAKVKANDLAIEIEAGMAFGTGHHGTTAGCLETIGRLVARKAPTNALDLGTGSAVLAIGIAKLARIPVLATDIDPVATRVAAANIRANGVHDLVAARTATGFHSPDIRERGPFDLIVANVLAGPLMAMAPGFARSLCAGGDLVLSGILAGQRDAVLAIFRIQRLYHRRTLTRGEWVTLHLSR